MILPPPALRLLARRKLRGVVRKQLRRVRTPAGAAFAILGGLVLLLWLGSIVFGFAVGSRDVADPDDARTLVRVGGLFLAVLSLTGALNYRGLYVPREEIEPLFSAPVSRADLVRYRLYVNMGRSLFATLIFGLLVLGRVPSPLYGFLGVFLALQTLGVVGQCAAILAGRAEKRLVERFRGLPTLLLVVLAIGGGCAILIPTLVDGIGDGPPAWLDSGREHLADSPLVAALTLPIEPWARAITAATLAEFAPWGVFCFALWILAFEGTARLPIDFRELSLETSASVAERIRRARRSGGGASASRISRRAAGWRVPWLFGRGPMGALAWRKTVSIVRKARGTLTVSILVLAFLTMFSTVLLDGAARRDVLAGATVIALVGTIYLSAGLRFDFREDLDAMERIRTWPLPPRRVFLGMLVPQVCLVTLLLEVAVLLRCLLSGSFPPGVLLIVLALPLVAFAWIAIDNALFLLVPVRFVPGQEGTLQNAGRALVMMFVRLLFLVVVGGPAATAGVLAYVGVEDGLGAGEAAAGMAAALAVSAVLLLADLGLVFLGGLALGRFDVARDRA